MEIKIHLTNDKFKKLVKNGRIQFDLYNEDEGHCVVTVTKESTCYKKDDNKPETCPSNCRIHGN